MDSTRLRQIEDLYHSVLEIATDERRTFLDRACGQDAELRREVESLLSFDETPEHFIDSPPASLAADLLADSEASSDLIGQQIGSYLIRAYLGSGGMGVVYLADDLRLERRVGLKLLHQNIAADAERRRRFELEARAASALNHPNILTIFEFGSQDGLHYLVTEYVEGSTLRHLIGAGELSFFESLKIAQQTAFALSSAHAAGILHRDIKPENIMIRRDGIVKVLDFGLAKLLARTDQSGSPSGDRDDPANDAKTRTLVKTNPGMVMGTVSYMSPEQVRGKETDARTDLWSLGVVLYEMIAGRVPFAEDTMNDSIAAILTKEPPEINQFVEDAPQELNRFLRKALTKDRDERYQTARDMMLDLKSLRRESESSGEFEHLRSSDYGVTTNAATAARRPLDTGRTAADTAKTQDEKYHTLNLEVEKIRSRYRSGVTAILAILLMAGLGVLGYLYFRPKRQFDTAFNKTAIEKISISGNVELTEISPDTRYLAYVERKGNNQTRLVLRQTENGAEKEILPMGISYVRDIEFSPDGNYFYYAFESLAEMGVRVDVLRIPLLGGAPEKVVENIRKRFSLSHDGKYIAFVRNEETPFESKVVLRDLRSKEERVLAAEKLRDFESLAFSPDGTKLGLLVSDSYGDDLYKLSWISTDGGEIRKISDTPIKPGSSFDWLSDGSGLLASALIPEHKYGQIYKIPFPQGEFTPITTSTSTFSGVSLSSDGSFMVARQTNKTNGIWEFDLASKTARQTVQTTKDELKIEDVTADNRLLISKTDSKGSNGFWLMNADGTNERLITSFNSDNLGPLQQAAITSDQKYCYYVSDNDVWRVDLNGGSKENLTNSPTIAKAFGGLSADSSYVLFQLVDPWSIQKLDIATRQITPVVESTSGDSVLFGVSRNTNLISYSAPTDAAKGSKRAFFTAPFLGNRMGEPISFVNITRSKGFVFSKDATRVYFTPYSSNPAEINDTEMAVKDISTGKVSKLTNFAIERILSYTITRDGTKLLLVRGNTTDEVVMIRNVE